MPLISSITRKDFNIDNFVYASRRWRLNSPSVFVYYRLKHEFNKKSIKITYLIVIGWMD